MSERDHRREAAARRAAEAGDVAAQALGDYGLGSPEAGGALAAASAALDEATAAGVDRDDVLAARRGYRR